MNTRTVLISGAGIAGSTLAYWLARHGFRTTVVERARGLRSSGNPVDVRGPAVPVAERMGVMPRLREAGTHVTDLMFINDAGRQVGRVNMRALRDAAASREVELPRGDLAAVLFDAAREDVELIFDDSIATMNTDAGGVDVTFEHAAPRRFDMVIGADGLHSTVRRLAFGPEDAFVRYMGLFVATLALGEPADNEHDVLMHNAPGRGISIHPARGSALAAFIFRHPLVADFDYRDTEQHKRIVAHAYADAGWRAPELLERVRAADDLYFDSVSQVRLDRWSRGRVALLGDAASCVSLFGEGSSLAIAGAATLADALASDATEPQRAFARYEVTHRLLVDPKQRNGERASAIMVPATRAGITARNLATRLWPVAAAVQRIGRPAATLAAQA